MKKVILYLYFLLPLLANAQRPIGSSTVSLGNAHVCVDENVYVVDAFSYGNRHSNRVTFIGPDIEIFIPYGQSIKSTHTETRNGVLYFQNVVDPPDLEFRIFIDDVLFQDWTRVKQVNRTFPDTIFYGRQVSRIISDTIPAHEVVVTGYSSRSDFPSPTIKTLKGSLLSATNVEPDYVPILRRILFSQKINVGDTVQVDMRYTDSKIALPTIYARRIPVRPVLHRTLYNDQIDKLITDDATIWNTVTSSSLALVPADSIPTSANIDLASNIDKALMIFARRTGKDSSLLIRFSKEGGPIIDSGLSGHKILLKNLQPGTKYNLTVSYKLQPETAMVYNIVIAPTWYQTALFKWMVAGILALLILAVATSYYRYKIRKQKQQQARIDLELKSIRSQLNPHFVFNSLSSIQGLINNDEIDKANIYLSEFGGLMRDTLSGGSNNNNSLAAEIKILDRYMQLEQLRFGFQFEINVDGEINLSSTEIPSLFLQPLVENAVKHGVAGMNGNGHIAINFKKRGADLLVDISDNGKGISPNNGNGNGNGFGIKLTQDRIYLLSQLDSEQKIEMNTHSTNEGTTVHLNFKNWI